MKQRQENGHEHEQHGGSRAAIFSRFHYKPDFPFISQYDKVYQASPVTFIGGRPYRFYSTPQNTWLNPWTFPQPMNVPRLQQIMTRCHEPVILVKKEIQKLGGLSAPTPPNIQYVSECFQREFNK